ncbi:hypothetical protein KSS87_022751 [Heliosperma pusillum]|nr:hypothetical protein KSS87_022751 [Heliosperma pusillum]
MADDRRDESENESSKMNGDGESSSSNDVIATVSGSTTAEIRFSSGGGLAERLNEIIMEGGDGDLLMQQSMRESNFLQWLQALDFQVMGACRADERLKPLLKVNDAAEDRLLSHLSQHFEASEVGLLARCLCVPLVSMRVGKLVKQGSLLCPVSLRGTLNLALLPSSDMRLSFVGDNGQTVRLVTLSYVSDCSTVSVEEIPADQSGRSFFVKLLDGETFYFWCSERSKLLGIDLLSKMKDFLRRKPTLADLTGISESRLECFATHLRAYLAGPTASSIQASTAASCVPWADVNQASMEPLQSSSTCVRSLRTRQNGCQASKGNTQYQGSLSPRPSTFKEGLPKSLSSLKSISREKIRRRGDVHLAPVDNSFTSEAVVNSLDKGNKSSEASPLSLLESLGKSNFLTSPSETLQLPPISSLLSPYYCWCPPCTSPSITSTPKLPTSFAQPFSLPPLSALFPATVTASLLPPPNLTGGSPFELPPLLSDPLVRSQPFPTFTPLMCDPIVHIPVLDLCSLGQGYLVSAGPGIATSIPPLHPKLMAPIISEGESLLEKGARETLRLLIGSSSGQASGSLMGVLPSVLSNENNQGVMVTGSRGLYAGISDVDAIVGSFAAVGLNSVPERSFRMSGLPSCTSTGPDAIEQPSCGPDFWNSAFTSGEDDKKID